MRWCATIESNPSLAAGAAIGNVFPVFNPAVAQYGMNFAVRKIMIAGRGASVDTQVTVHAALTGIGVPGTPQNAIVGPMSLSAGVIQNLVSPLAGSSTFTAGNDPGGSPVLGIYYLFATAMRTYGNPTILEFERGDLTIPFISGGPTVYGITASKASLAFFNDDAAAPTGFSYIVTVELEDY